MKKARTPQKNGCRKRTQYAYPWHDNESELAVALRTSGMSYDKAIMTNFKPWRNPGLQRKYLALLKLPKWKERLEPAPGDLPSTAQCCPLSSTTEAGQARHQGAGNNVRMARSAAVDNNIDDTMLVNNASDGFV